MAKLQVLLADDHRVVREGLKLLLDAQADMEVIGEAADGPAAWEQARHLRPDIVVLDMSMPELNGAQVSERLKQDCPEVKVVFLTMHEDAGYLRQLLKAGAAGCVLKRSAAQELTRAIRVVAAGGTYLDPALTEKVTTHYVQDAGGDRAAGADLSAREVEVLRRIAAGHSNKEIAGQLGLSVKTVETYKARLMAKLGIYTRAEMVRYALRRGWLPDAG